MAGGGGSSTTVQKADPWEGAQPYLNDLYYRAAEMAKNVPLQYFPQQNYAAKSPMTEAGEWAALSAGLGTDAYRQSMDAALQSQLNAPNVAENNYVNQMIQNSILGQQLAVEQTGDTLIRNLERRMLPEIRAGAGLAGQFGSTRQGIAEGVAIGDTSRALSDYASNAQNQLANSIAQTQLGAYGQGLDAQARATMFLPQAAQMGMMPAQALLQKGASEEGYRQQAIADAIARYQYNMMAPWEALNMQNAIVSGAPWGSTQTMSGGGGSTAANVIGGALTGAGLATPLAMAGGPLANGIAALGSPFAGMLGMGGAFALPLMLGGGLLGAFS